MRAQSYAFDILVLVKAGNRVYARVLSMAGAAMDISERSIAHSLISTSRNRWFMRSTRRL